MTRTLSHFIGGRAVAGSSGRFADVFDPATGDVTARLPLADAADAAVAVAAAEAAFPAWAATPPVVRARVLFRFRELVERHADSLVRIIVSEHGKVREDARAALMRGIEVVEFACGIPHLLKGEFSEAVAGETDSWSLRQPLGVAAGITPFNFPAMVPMWMFPLAIAAGNTFVLKPSEKVPSCALRLAELLHEAGLPDGVFNVLNGDGAAVDALLADPRVQAVSFVGSTPVARHVYATGSAHGKRVQALAGAKNHMVVMPDADMAQAADALMGAAYGSAGERCMAVAVAVAVGSAGDAIRERLAPRVRALKVGPGLDPESEMGPLISAAHRDRVAGYVDLGIAEGAELVVDGRNLSLQGYENGFFLGGCLFDHVRPDMRIYQEEIFGPVLGIVRADALDDALSLVNRHPYGNGAAIFTRDGDAARAFVSGVAAGMVGVNVAIPVPMAFMSFGGWKQSRFGDLAVHGKEGVQFYTRLKTVTARWPSGTTAGARFAMPTSA
ncbi:MAG: CoA-acylating methylmalonate-semialdehyde dehydrogenase [Rhodospirillales bacterium]|nr:MAG: CoA-acylating methylmalonate-semialdehyde dehydrogenase [Rhodospirillales bacterium]